MAPLHVRHDKCADRTVITPAAEAHMAMMILTRLDLFTLEQVACRDVEPAGYCLHQLMAGDGEAIHIAATDQWIPGMCKRRDGCNQRRYNKQCYSHRRNSFSVGSDLERRDF